MADSGCSGVESDGRQYNERDEEHLAISARCIRAESGLNIQSHLISHFAWSQTYEH